AYHHCRVRCSHLHVFLLTSLSFFYSYGDHRDLHSFPTRRSSDLSGYAEVASDRIVALEASGIRLPPLTPGQRIDRAERMPEASRDRKSTRLNSSHVSISYAVFCLKKKKKKENKTA